MKKWVVSFGILAAVFGFGFSGAAHAAQSPLAWSVSVTPVSNYIWRGFSSNLNRSAIQPSLTIAHPASGLSVNGWGSFNAVSQPGTTSDIGEADLTVDWTGSVAKGANLSVGGIYYTFPNIGGGAKNTTEEIYAGLSFPEAIFSPTLRVITDMDLGTGTYVNVGGSLPFALGSQTMVAGLNAGWNSEMYITGSTVSDINLSLGTSAQFAGLSLTPQVVYTIVPQSAVDRGINTNSQLWGGLTVGAAF